MSITGFISQLLRKTGLLTWADTLRMYAQKLKYYTQNRRFRKEHPQVILPDDAILYETFNLDYRKYYLDGKQVARWLLQIYRDKHGEPPARLLDWGCGPARTIRHMPPLVDPGNELFATDFNPSTIKWCKENIRGIDFSTNSLNPPLRFPSGFFDFIYGISVLTHLNEARHQAWTEELLRVLTPGGILLLTTQGRAFTSRLTPKELTVFLSGHLVVRGNTEEGRRVFSAFHPPKYMKSLFQALHLIEHQEGKMDERPEQDIWILQKPITG